MTNRKPTRAELELKIAEQEKLNEEQTFKIESYERLYKEHSRQLKIHADINLLQKDVIDKLTKEKQELFSANLSLSEKVNELQSEVSKAISKLKGTLQTIVMKLGDFYWCVPQLKKDIKNIIND